MLADWCSHRSAACPPGIAEEDFEELEGTHLRPDVRLGPAGGCHLDRRCIGYNTYYS